MDLSYKDYIEMAGQVDVSLHEIDYKKDGETLCIEYDYEEEGEVDDNYYTGTGAYTRVYACFTVKEVSAYNDDGEEVQTNFCEETLKEIIEKI